MLKLKLREVAGAALVAMAALGVGQQVGAYTICEDNIMGGNCNYVGSFSKTCCVDDGTGYKYLTSLTDKYQRGTAVYWSGYDFSGTWGGSCLPSTPRTCC